jgi:hypothetical protein
MYILNILKKESLNNKDLIVFSWKENENFSSFKNRDFSISLIFQSNNNCLRRTIVRQTSVGRTTVSDEQMSDEQVSDE